MLRDNLVELIEPMLNSAGANPLALTHHQIQASGDRLPCLENPRPKGAESSLTENVTSPFQSEPAHKVGWLLLEHQRRSAYSLAFKVDYHLDTVGDLDQRNAFIHPIILAVEGHRPFNLT